MAALVAVVLLAAGFLSLGVLDAAVTLAFALTSVFALAGVLDPDFSFTAFFAGAGAALALAAVFCVTPDLFVTLVLAVALALGVALALAVAVDFLATCFFGSAFAFTFVADLALALLAGAFFVLAAIVLIQFAVSHGKPLKIEQRTLPEQCRNAK
ncbi:MAG: hypothetical protein KDI36_07985 [Pseudomonadales bacterium]|nr:hypothetical protein [Pseudomonadales bacterium]